MRSRDITTIQIACLAASCYEPYPKLRHRHKNGRCSVGTFVKFVWATMGRKFLNGNISAKKENIEL